MRRRRSSGRSEAIHEGDADSKLLAYQYLQMLPKIAEGESNKLWVIPSEFSQALANLTSRFADGSPPPPKPKPRSRATRSTPARPPMPRRPPALRCEANRGAPERDADEPHGPARDPAAPPPGA